MKEPTEEEPIEIFKHMLDSLYWTYKILRKIEELNAEIPKAKEMLREFKEEMKELKKK